MSIFGRMVFARDRYLGLATELYALFLALRDPRSPVFVRLLAIAAGIYVLSPIDIVPDPLPLLGIADDLAMIPLTVAVVSRIIPETVLEQARVHAEMSRTVPRVWLAVKLATAMIVIIWLTALAAAFVYIYQTVG